VAVLVLLLLRKYTRLEFVGMPGCCLKHGLSAWAAGAGWCMGSVIPGCALHAWAMLPPDIKDILPPNVVAMISPALVVLAISLRQTAKAERKGR
jgi:hypothetical protein